MKSPCLLWLFDPTKAYFFDTVPSRRNRLSIIRFALLATFQVYNIQCLGVSCRLWLRESDRPLMSRPAAKMRNGTGSLAAVQNIKRAPIEAIADHAADHIRVQINVEGAATDFRKFLVAIVGAQILNPAKPTV